MADETVVPAPKRKKISFSSVELISFTRTAHKGVLKCKASFSSDVQTKLGWAEIPECFKGSDLEGELDTPVVELTPSDSAMARHAFTLDTTQIKSFKTVRLELEGKRGKGYRTELHFSVLFADLKGARKLEEYMLTVGKSRLSASYTLPPVQTTLPGAEESEAADAQAELVQ